MQIQSPFIIGPRRLPALKVGGAWLSLELDGSQSPDGRDIAGFTLDIPDGTMYVDRELKSGCQGFRSSVEAFESFLGFLSACADSLEYANYSSDGGTGENANLFPSHIGEWALDNKYEIEEIINELTDYNGMVRHELIED